jgi:hypothetical protein
MLSRRNLLRHATAGVTAGLVGTVAAANAGTSDNPVVTITSLKFIDGRRYNDRFRGAYWGGVTCYWIGDEDIVCEWETAVHVGIHKTLSFHSSCPCPKRDLPESFKACDVIRQYIIPKTIEHARSMSGDATIGESNIRFVAKQVIKNTESCDSHIATSHVDLVSFLSHLEDYRGTHYLPDSVSRMAYRCYCYSDQFRRGYV